MPTSRQIEKNTQQISSIKEHFVPDSVSLIREKHGRGRGAALCYEILWAFKQNESGNNHIIVGAIQRTTSQESTL